MIRLRAENTSPFSPGEFMTVKRDSSLITIQPEAATNGICYCELECTYIEYAFAQLDSDITENGYSSKKNDRSTFIFKKAVAADSITFELLKSGDSVANLNDNTYGELITYAEQPLYVQFTVDWKKVFDVFGAGYYQFKANKTILGSSSEFLSHNYKLNYYQADRADETIKIEAYQNGNILSSPFDFTGLNVYTSYRIKGKFGNKKPVVEKSSYVNEDLEEVQNRINLINEYTLTTDYIPEFIYNELIYNQSVANTLLITDYNIMNAEVYTEKSVVLEDISEPTYPESNRRAKWELKLRDKIQDNIKTNK